MVKKDFSHKDLINGIRVVFRNALQYRRLFYSALILSSLYCIVSPIDTILFGKFIDSLGKSEFIKIGSYTISIYTALLCGWLLLQVIEIFLQRNRVLASLRLGQYVRTSYIARVSGHIFRLPISYHKNTKMGEVQEKITTAATGMGNILEEDVTIILPQVFSLAIFFYFIAVLDIYVFLFVLTSILFYVFVTVKTTGPTAGMQRESQKMYTKVRGIVVDAITNIRIVKDFATEKFKTEEIRSGYQDKAMPIWYRLMRQRRKEVFLQQLISAVSRFVVLLASIYFVKEGMWTIGSLVIVNSYMNRVYDPILQISKNWRNIQNSIINIEDTEAILALPTENYIELKSGENMEMKGKIEFKDVSFGYSDDKRILQDISFSANPSDIVALVGESGVGKSSLIDLISAYYKPQQGEIFVDDKNILDIPLEKLRHNIAVVTQELTLFNDTIKNNIKYGNFSATDEEVKSASIKAHCHDFIEKFPEKWEQVVGERGLKLSVGQKQRIAIARAILKNPKILILDEPTSALDAGSEKIILESLDELMKGKTTFVVAHRLSTVRKAHTILVFKDGKIVESGTHDELVKKENGEYRRLYELQSGLV